MVSGTPSQSENKASSPYHIIVSYRVEANGYLGGGFHVEPMGFSGGVGGRTLAELHAECYESLAAGIDSSHHVPFDTTDLRKSVVFDFVECFTDEEHELALKMMWADDTFDSIIEAIQQ